MNTQSNTKAIAFILVLSYLLIGCDNSKRLYEKARTTNFPAEFIECCSKLQDQKLIADLALNLDSWAKRRVALDYITDKTMLEKVASQSKDLDIRKYATDRLDALKSGTSLDEVPKLVIHLIVIDSKGIDMDAELPNGSNATWDEVTFNVVKNHN